MYSPCFSFFSFSFSEILHRLQVISAFEFGGFRRAVQSTVDAEISILAPFMGFIPLIRNN